jgi:hypothetical protein
MRQQQQNQHQQQHRTRALGEDEAAEEDEQPASSTSNNRESNSQYRVQPFVEGVSDYDAYQQAWRMLGFMIDCNTVSAYDQSQNNNNNKNNGHSNDNDGTGEGCTRYVLWAAVRCGRYRGLLSCIEHIYIILAQFFPSFSQPFTPLLVR